MKHIKTFDQLNEGIGSSLSAAFTSDLDKDYKLQIKTIEDISKSILSSSDLKNLLSSVQKENPDVKQLKKYIDLASKSQKLISKVKSNGLSNRRSEAKKQIKALTEFAESLKDGFKLIKNFKTKAEKGLKSNEGIGNVVGNTLRNVLTGKWIVNILKSVKSNLVDSENEFKSVQDVFDINDY